MKIAQFKIMFPEVDLPLVEFPPAVNPPILIRKELPNNELPKEISKDNSPSLKVPKEPSPNGEKREDYGEHVKLKPSEFKALCEQHTEAKVRDFIDRVNDYCSATGKTYKGWAAAIRTFIRNDSLKNPANVQFDPNAALKRRQSSKLATPGDFEKDTYKRRRL